MNKIILASVALLASASAASAQVRLGTEGAYMPFNGLDDNNEVTGFERDVGDALCAAAGLECVWVINEWDTIIPNLVAGNYDAIIAGMSITAERDEVIDFTAEYFPPSPSLFVAMSDSEIKVVAAQTNTIQSGYVAGMDGVKLLEFPTPDETLNAVRDGVADAVLADGDFLLPIVEESSDLMVVRDPVFIGGGVGMGIRETDGELKAQMDAAIEAIKADGSLNAMLTEWFGADKAIY